MYPSRFRYHRATSIADAVTLLRDHEGAALLSGGHSLIPAMKLRAAQPDAVVDIGRIPGLDGIVAEGDSLVIGALATHAAVADSALVRERCPALAEAAAAIGDIQVRNRGTIGGSLAHADPGADYPGAVLALGARITAASSGESGQPNLPFVPRKRTISAGDFFVDLLQTALEPGELITSVRVPAVAGSAYLKHRHPASSYAVVGIAARVELADGIVESCAVGVNGVTGRALLAAGVAESLAGGPPSAERIEAAAERVAEALEDPLGDLYASGEFRVHLAGVYAKRALTLAAERAV